MIQKTILLMCLLLGLSTFSQINAVTDTGEVVLLFKDNTWKYVNDSINETKEISTNNFEFKKDENSTFLVRSKKMSIGIWLNPKKWSFKKNNTNEAAEFSFTLKNEDLYGMVITEKTEIPLLNLKQIALDNAKEVAPDIKIDKEEFRTVNGKKILMMELGGTTQGIKFKYYAYYYSSKKGVVQLVTYCSLNLFEAYKKEMEKVLNGLVELD